MDGKLIPNWKDSYIVKELRKNEAYVVGGYQGKKVSWLWNTEKLKKYYL